MVTLARSVLIAVLAAGIGIATMLIVSRFPAAAELLIGARRFGWFFAALALWFVARAMLVVLHLRRCDEHERDILHADLGSYSAGAIVSVLLSYGYLSATWTFLPGI